jgi:hypothetical protein
VVISRNVAQVSGTVIDALLQPSAGAQVVLAPDRRRDNIELFHVATADAQGRYTLNNIAPGDYKLFAWEAIEYGQWFDPNVLKKYESFASPLHLRESAQERVDVRHIPAETP